jgi:hypothetical protein
VVLPTVALGDPARILRDGKEHQHQGTHMRSSAQCAYRRMREAQLRVLFGSEASVPLRGGTLQNTAGADAGFLDQTVQSEDRTAIAVAVVAVVQVPLSYGAQSKVVDTNGLLVQISVLSGGRENGNLTWEEMGSYVVQTWRD